MVTTNHHKKMAYGPEVDLDGIPNLFAPQTVQPYTPPPTGIDNLGIISTDTFMVPGVGEDTVDFNGWVRVARSRPTADGWAGAEVYTNLLEMYMKGTSQRFGDIIVRLQPEVLSTGMIKTPFCDDNDQAAKACRMAVGAQFELPRLGMMLFNKEPIELTIDNVRSIPPAGNPGKGQIYNLLPLFSRSAPNDPPVAFLTSLKFQMGSYLTEDQLVGR
jgi:Family of unknown function (DUF6073)